MQENDSFENRAHKKNSCSEEIAPSKEQLLCQSSYSKEVGKSSLCKYKAVLKIANYARRELN